MDDYCGVYNQILHVNLSDGKIGTIDLSPDIWKKCIGGKALGAYLLNRREIYNRDPLGEDNEIMMLVGPLTGSLGPGASKTIMFTRSPLTRGYLDTTSGGSLAFHLKSSGYDGLIITGKSPDPVILEILDGAVQIKKAQDIWGKGCFEAEQTLRNTYGPRPAVVLIGPAGENLVKFACVHSDFYHQFGRGGAGAVFGSKKLKGLVVSGNRPAPFFKSKELLEKQFSIIRRAMNDEKARTHGRYGTMSTMDLMQKLGGTTVRNFTEGVSDRYDEEINRDAIKKYYGKKNLACFGCSVPCGNGVQFEYGGQTYYLGGPEYEAMALIGTNLDMTGSQLLYLNWVMDDLGMDLISAGVTLSCATEAVETGKLDPARLGFNLRWGGVEEASKAAEAIAFRKGSGDLMAEGCKAFTQAMDLDERLAIHVKGMELPGYDPRSSIGYALAYAIADRGGCHRRARPILKEAGDDAYRFAYDGKAQLVRRLEDERGFYHSLIVCDFIPRVQSVSIEEYASLLNLATGGDYDEQSVLRIGERAMNLSRLFNRLCGFSLDDDRLPDRFFREKMPRGGSEGSVLDKSRFKKMLEEYYEERGWGDTGFPGPEKLQELDMNDLRVKINHASEN